MDKASFTKGWDSKCKISSLVGSVGLALLIVSQIRNGRHEGAREGRGIREADSAADQEATHLEQVEPAAFTASVTIEDKGSIAAQNGVTVKADFIGMNDDVPLFADLTVFRGIYGVASWRAPVGSTFYVFVAGNGWCRLTVEEINFLPPEVGESDEHAEQDVKREPPAKLNVILSIENAQTFP